jgi:multicomponent Na+:H+ antiporter subunit D
MIIAAILVPLVPKRARTPITVAVPLIALAHVWGLEEGARLTLDVAGYSLHPLHLDALGRAFATVFAIVTAIGAVYAWHTNDVGHQVASLVYGGAAIGVALAGDLLTLLVFVEIMAVFSTYLVWARRTDRSYHAGIRYLIAHLMAGAVLLAGILLHLAETGDLAIVVMDSGAVASWVILLGVAINAAIPPLHAWLPDAYPNATITGAVLLSALTTKASVYMLIRMFPGYEILIAVGVAMALYGVVYAVLANDIRAILAYHIISQVGYMVAAVGIGTELALNGAVAHAFSHILYKGLLFMGAGAAIHATGRSRLTDLGGLFRSQRAIFWLYMIGAFSISGFPLFNGFISKSIVVDAAGYSGYVTAMLLLYLASIGTFLHTGLKLPYWTWFGEDRDIPSRPIPRTMYIAMAAAAGLCTLFGVAPGLLYELLPYQMDYAPYTAVHLIETSQLLLLTFVAFWFLRHKLAGEARIALDTDWLFRRPAGWLRRFAIVGTTRISGVLDGGGRRAASAVTRLARDPRSVLVARRPGDDARSGFDPDAARPALGVVIAITVLVVVLVAVASLSS